SEPIGQPLPDETRQDVCSAARGVWHDDAYRPRRIALRQSSAGQDGHRRSARQQMEKSTTWKIHQNLPRYVRQQSMASAIARCRRPKMLSKVAVRWKGLNDRSWHLAEVDAFAVECPLLGQMQT